MYRKKVLVGYICAFILYWNIPASGAKTSDIINPIVVNEINDIISANIFAVIPPSVVFDFGPYIKPSPWVSKIPAASASQVGRKNALNGSVPRRWDARDLELIGPVPDQGTDGWCWAYAAVGAMEASLRKKGYKVPTLSPASLVNAVFNDPDTSKRFLSPNINYGSQGKNDPMAAAQSGGNMLSTAAVLARLSPVRLQGQKSAMSAIRVKRISKIVANRGKNGRVMSASEIHSVKKIVLRDGAALVSYDGAPVWYEKKTASHRCVGVCVPNHAALIVGWDDTYDKGRFKESVRPSSDGAWLVRNNWGKHFGDGGYFWLSYEDMGITDTAGFDTVPVNENLKRYGHDDFGVNRVIWMGREGAGRMSAVFEAEENSRLSEVGFYIPSDGVQWKISIRVMRPMDANKRLSELRPMEILAGQAAESGFYTAQVKNHIRLNKGDWFSVELQASCLAKSRKDGLVCKFPLAVEVAGGVSRVDSNARVARSEGWFSGDGKNWVDGYDMGKINPCLEAYVLVDKQGGNRRIIRKR